MQLIILMAFYNFHKIDVKTFLKWFINNCPESIYQWNPWLKRRKNVGNRWITWLNRSLATVNVTL